VSTLRGVALLLLAVVLAGCVRAEIELSVTSERTVEGTVLLAWHTDFLERIERDPAEAQQEILDDLADDAPDGMACAPFEDDEAIGATCTLDGVRLEDMNEAEVFNQRLTFVEAGDDVVLSAVVDLDEVPADESMEASVRVTFPGRVIDASGPIDGRTAIWEPKAGERTELQATARLLPESQAPIPFWVFTLILAVVALVVVIAGVEWMQVRRR
jgi:hypothetical protein